jgi:methyl acetate hydrolase
VKFMQMLLRGGAAGKTRILQAKTVAIMAQNQIGDLQAGRLTSVMPDLSNDVDFHPGFVDKFGLGFLINPVAYQGGRSKGSLAWAGLANTYFWIDPGKKMCAVILMQILPFVDKEGISLLRNFEREVYKGR